MNQLPQWSNDDLLAALSDALKLTCAYERRIRTLETILRETAKWCPVALANRIEDALQSKETKP